MGDDRNGLSDAWVSEALFDELRACPEFAEGANGWVRGLDVIATGIWSGPDNRCHSEAAAEESGAPQAGVFDTVTWNPVGGPPTLERRL